MTVANTPKDTQVLDKNNEINQQLGQKIVIAIDGPAASGKGTLSKMLAEHLGYAYLDTGALYRAVAFTSIQMGANPERFIDISPAIEILKRNLTPELLKSPELRSHEVSEISSKVAALPEVRAELIDYQREFSKNPPEDHKGSILDGRDIGTVICPDADIKFFITASVEERARRRFKDMKENDPFLKIEDVREEIEKRDLRDSSRDTAPTAIAKDAIVLDTTGKTVEDSFKEMITLIRQKHLLDSNTFSKVNY